MEQPGRATLRTPLPRPSAGATVCVRQGGFEFVLEAARGGLLLLVHDGRQAHKWSLGLGADDRLAVVPQVPAHPLRIALREHLALVPGARLRGYVLVPLVPAVVREPGGGAALAEVHPAALAAEWSDEDGSVVMKGASSFCHRLPAGGDPFMAVVPVVLRNLGSVVAHPGELPLRLRGEELRALRGSLVAAPRRLLWTGEGGWRERVQGWHRQVAA